MDTSQDILVIILSTTLAILLVLSIAIAVMVIMLLQTLKRLTDKAERVIETAEHVGEAFSNATGSMALFKVVRNVAEFAARHAAKDKKKD
jgi:hypothetical protein